jgi:hypothetical protein
MNPARLLLSTLSDIEGVVGSFLLSDVGGLIATDLPATFDTAAFAEAGPRIVRLSELGGSYGEQTKFLVMRFAEYKLYVRVIAGAFLGVLLTPVASVPALKAAAGVLARRLEALLIADHTRSPDTLPAPPRFDDRASHASPPSEFVSRSEKRPSTRPGGSALSAPPALTNTLPSMGMPEPELTSPAGARRNIRFRGRSM